MSNADLAIVIKAVDEASGVLQKVAGELGGVGQAAERTDGPLGGFGGALGKVGLAAGAVGLAGTAVIGVLSDLAREAMKAEDVQAQLNAVLESTGGVAGVSAEMADELATSLSKVTTFDDEAIKSSEALLLTFTNIGQNVFPAATETVLNMSQALGQDLQSSAVQLGKALQDPINGVTALRRVGVSLTDQQEAQIKAMVEAGDVAGAQAVILKELQTEFGGVARAAGETTAGQLTILSNEFDNMKEELGAQLLPIILEGAKVLREILPAATMVAKVALTVLIEPIKLIIDGFKLLGSIFGTSEPAEGVKGTATNVQQALATIPVAVRDVAAAVPKEIRDAQEKVAKEVEKLTRDAGRKLEEVAKAEMQDLAKAQQEGAERVADARQKAAETIAKAHEEAGDKIAEVIRREDQAIADLETEESDKIATAQDKAALAITKAQEDAAAKMVEAQDKFGREGADAVRQAAEAVVDAQKAATQAVQAAIDALTDSRAQKARREMFDESQAQAALVRKRAQEDAEAIRKFHADLESAKTAEERAQIEARFKVSEADRLQRRKVEDDDRAFAATQAKARQAFEAKIEDENLAKKIATINEERGRKTAHINQELADKEAKLKDGLTRERAQIQKSLGEKESDINQSLGREVAETLKAGDRKEADIHERAVREADEVRNGLDKRIAATEDGLAKELVSQQKALDKKLAAVAANAQEERDKVRESLQLRIQDLQTELAEKTAKMKVKAPTMDDLDASTPIMAGLKRAAVDPAVMDVSRGVGHEVTGGISVGMIAAEAMAALRRAAGAVVDFIGGALRAAGLISSPSKLMAERVGAPLAQGVIQGMLAERGSVEQALAELIGPRALSPSITASVGGGVGGSAGSAVAVAGAGAGRAAPIEVRVYLDSRELRNVVVSTDQVNSARGRG